MRFSTGGLIDGVEGCEKEFESERSVRDGVDGGPLMELCDDDEFKPDSRDNRHSISSTMLAPARGEGLTIGVVLVGD
jgi:hypothetical protein